MKKFIPTLFALIAIMSCKDDDTTETDTGSVILEFSNKVGTNDLVLNTGSYINLSNETYTISELKYIVSNIVLIKENGEEFIYPVENSYFLINEKLAESKKNNLVNIPSGTYTKIKFGIGVDPSKYPFESGMASFIPTAEENDMIWDWNSGYKFVKFEGAFMPQGGEQKDFLIHVGSHGELLDNYKEVILDLPNAIIVNEAPKSIAIDADIAKIFDSTYSHSLNEKNEILIDPENAPKIAENVSTMFNAIAMTNSKSQQEIQPVYSNVLTKEKNIECAFSKQ